MMVKLGPPFAEPLLQRSSIPTVLCRQEIRTLLSLLLTLCFALLLVTVPCNPEWGELHQSLQKPTLEMALSNLRPPMHVQMPASRASLHGTRSSQFEPSAKFFTPPARGENAMAPTSGWNGIIRSILVRAAQAQDFSESVEQLREENRKLKAENAKLKAQAVGQAVPKGPGGLLIAGESLIDMIPAESSAGRPAFVPCPGGAPFNAILAARRLGMPTTYLAVLSSDFFGDKLFGILEGEGVNLEYCSRIARPTTLAFVKRKETGKGEDYAFFKENAADRALTKDRVQEVLSTSKFDAVHLSLGAVTLEAEKMVDAFEEMFQLTGEHGSLRSFDMNVRSNMIKNRFLYVQKLEHLLRNVDIVKASDDDIAFLYGGDAEIKDVAKRWLAIGPKLAIVTKGGEGSVAFPKAVVRTGDIEIAIPIPGERPNTINEKGDSAPVRDTVGAGDTFMGATIDGLMSTREYEWVGSDAPLLAQFKHGKAWDDTSLSHLRDILQRAAVAAAINCSRAGCEPPSSEEVVAAGRALSLSFALRAPD